MAPSLYSGPAIRWYLTTGGEGTGQSGQERIRQLEQELRRKDKALAEAAALLILQKKLDAYWSNVDEDELTSLPERQQYVAWWREALEAGARKHPAAEALGLSLRTLQRWLAEPELSADRRPDAVRSIPAHALSPRGAQAVLDVCNSQEFASLPPRSNCATAGRPRALPGQ